MRDALLNRPVYDLDLAAPAGDAIKAARRIADHFKGDIFVMDREREVARVFLDFPDGRLNLDIAGFRGETLADDLEGRRDAVALTAICLGEAQEDFYWVSFRNPIEHPLQLVLNLFQKRSVRLYFAARLFP